MRLWNFAAAVLLSGCLPSESEPPCVPETVLRGPWAVGYYSRSVEIRFETATASCGGARLRAEGSEAWLAEVRSSSQIIERTITVGTGALQEPDEPSQNGLHRVVISELEPGTCYRYQISQPTDGTVINGRVCTAPEVQTELLRLAVIGDTNPTLGRTEVLYDHILQWAPSALLHMGDIQYYDSVIETWSSWFTRTGALLSGLAVLPAVGNHEFETITGQEVEGEGVPLEFTQYFLPLWGGHAHPSLGNNYAWRAGGVQYIVLDSESNTDSMWDPEVGRWLDEMLASAELTEGHRFSVLYFHRPILSRSRHGGDLARLDRFEQLIAGHNVPLVLVGHAHCYERFAANNITYIVTGGGGAAPYSCDNENEEVAHLQEKAITTYHWLQIEQGLDTYTVRAIDDTGTTLDTWELNR
jgi:acid phosphatase type 7